MPKIIKYAVYILLGSLGWVAFAHAADAPSLAEHSDALVWIIVGLVTLINTWVAVTWKDMKVTIKEIRSELSSVKERIVATEAACKVRHGVHEGGDN